MNKPIRVVSVSLDMIDQDIHPMDYIPRIAQVNDVVLLQGTSDADLSDLGTLPYLVYQDSTGNRNTKGHFYSNTAVVLRKDLGSVVGYSIVDREDRPATRIRVLVDGFVWGFWSIHEALSYDRGGLWDSDPVLNGEVMDFQRRFADSRLVVSRSSRRTQSGILDRFNPVKRKHGCFSGDWSNDILTSKRVAISTEYDILMSNDKVGVGLTVKRLERSSR